MLDREEYLVMIRQGKLIDSDIEVTGTIYNYDLKIVALRTELNNAIIKSVESKHGLIEDDPKWVPVIEGVH